MKRRCIVVGNIKIPLKRSYRAPIDKVFVLPRSGVDQVRFNFVKLHVAQVATRAVWTVGMHFIIDPITEVAQRDLSLLLEYVWCVVGRGAIQIATDSYNIMMLMVDSVRT